MMDTSVPSSQASQTAASPPARFFLAAAPPPSTSSSSDAADDAAEAAEIRRFPPPAPRPRPARGGGGGCGGGAWPVALGVRAMWLGKKGNYVGIISSHLAAVRTPVFSEVKRIIALGFSEVKRTIHLLLYVDFVLLYDDFDCNIFFGPVIRHEYCNTFGKLLRGALLYEI